MTLEKLTVLVVDDEESVRNLLQRILEGGGYNVVTAADGREALDKLSELEIAAVLLDIKMPGMSGMEVLQRITKDWPETSVIMVTAVGDAQTAIEAMKMGAYDYIIKPFNHDDLVLKVRRAIEKRNLMLENERHRRELEQRVGEQAERLQQLFVELVETLAREHKLLYRQASQQRGGKEMLSKLPPELREPMASVEEFSEALLRILRGGLGRWPKASTDKGQDSKR